MRLVAVLASPAPYTTPVLNALANRLDLHAIYLAAEDRISRFDDSFGVEPEFDHSVHWVKHLHIPSIDFRLGISAGIASHVSKLEPHALLLSSWKPAVLEPLLWSRWSGSAAVMWAESTPFSGLLRDPISTGLRRMLTRTFDTFVSNGSQATRYLLQLGVSPDRVVTSSLPAAKAAEIAERTSTPSHGGVRFLFVGRLISQKRPLELIAAFQTVRKTLPDATLTVVGGGELEAEVRAASASVDGVRYVGRCEGKALASYYSESDVLVLPALREVWGIVVNEALSHGLFVVATDQVGAAYDLLDDDTGLMLPAEQVDRLAPALIETGRSLDVTEAARSRRAAAVAHCTPDRFAADIQRAAELGIRVRAKRWRRP